MRKTRAIPLPGKDELYKLVVEWGKQRAGEHYGVSESTIIKWVKKYELPVESRKKVRNVPPILSKAKMLGGFHV